MCLEQLGIKRQMGAGICLKANSEKQRKPAMALKTIKIKGFMLWRLFKPCDMGIPFLA